MAAEHREYARAWKARLTQPLDDDDRFLWHAHARYADEITKRIRSQPVSRSSCKRAVEQLTKRILDGQSTLWVLRAHAQHGYTLDAMMILRGMYDAQLQALYIMHDAARAEELATLYLEFEWIEKRRYKRVIDRNDSDFARRLKSSEKRAVAEPHMDAEYQRVRVNYVDKNDEDRDNWYVGSLRTLAQKSGARFEAEYELLFRHLHGAAHASPFATSGGFTMEPDLLLTAGWRIVFRTLGRIAQLNGIGLEGDHRDLVDDANANLFDQLPPEQGPGPSG